MKSTIVSGVMPFLLTGALAFGAISDAAIPPFNTIPGTEYADSVRMFQGIPAIERAPNGRLWAAWYGGGVTEDRHNYIILDTSGDEGRTWERALILDPDRDGPVRAFDPCLWHDPSGRLWLFWAQRGLDGVAYSLAITTQDSGKAKASWAGPRPIFDGIMMNKPTVDQSGRWLLPMAFWRSIGSARMVASTDRGLTFSQIGAANIPKKEDRNCDEPMLVQRTDDTFWLLVRTQYGIGESVSTDGGKTWPDVAPTSIPHPTTRFFIRRLVSGRLLLVRHDPPDGARVRSHLKAFLSDDDGRTWQGGLLLDERRNVSYPDGVQAKNGLIYIIYDWERQREKEILMSTFRENDVLQGKLASADGRFRIRINQATGMNPAPKPR
jgi:predicted neuraminidase